MVLHANTLRFPGDLLLKNLGDVAVGELSSTTAPFSFSCVVILASGFS